ncbi:MAG: helix-turn-helix domain-containing protein, partial [Planctomycetota bacterium]
MPRRDLTKERTEQILDALERCVVHFGLGGTSLERIAEEAEMKRSILRHYVGNRDDLIVAMAERLAARYRRQL